MSNNFTAFPAIRRSTVEQNQCGCVGTGTLILSFITGLAAGIAAALLIAKSNDKNEAGEEHEDQLFI
jgi:hypothetical protein